MNEGTANGGARSAGSRRDKQERSDGAADRLLRAAKQCVLRYGLAGSTVKRMAGLAGVSHGLVHYYFGSRDALLAEVARRERSVVAAPAAAILMGRFPADGVAVMAEDQTQLVLMLELGQCPAAQPEVRHYIGEQLESIAAGMRRTRDDPNGRTSALATLGLVVGHALSAPLLGSQPERDQLMPEWRRVIGTG